ncbi:MAG: apolipoprotein A1/A4/E family protein [Desulfobacterota bacterium]|jgi:ElaB/YqjD/DUF883 family membrane-anchored ribosome-binding protein|nr:apolipoprotein A1/A4/E family protein [Thermodesulfobacteriota bacterium]
MDFKKLVDQVKDAAEDLKDKAETKVKEIRESLDKDGDHMPDALEGLTEKAKGLAAQAQEKAKGLAGLAGEKFEQAGAKLGELVDQGQAKLQEVQGEAKKAVDAARGKVGLGGKDR